MAQSVAWVLVALVTFQVAAAHPAHKPEQRRGDAADGVALSLAMAIRAQAEAESALGDVLQAAAIGDLTAAQDAADRANQAAEAALDQAQLATVIAVHAAGGQVSALGQDVSDDVYLARDAASQSIVHAFQDAGDELQDFAWRAWVNEGPLPRGEVDDEVRKFNSLGSSAIVEFSRILDSSILSSKSKIAGTLQQIQILEIEVVKASEAAQAAVNAAAAAQEANAQATTLAPTPAPTDAPTAAPTQAPTAAPTDAPTQAPTDAPTPAPTSAPTAAPTQAPTNNPVNSRKRGSFDVDPFEAAKLVLAKIDAGYSGYASYAKYYAESITKDAFSTAVALVDDVWLKPGDDDVVDAMSKLLYGTDDILGAVDAKLWEVNQAVLDALNSLEQ